MSELHLFHRRYIPLSRRIRSGDRDSGINESDRFVNAEVCAMSIASLRRAKEKLDEALDDLRVLQRAGVDTSFPQIMLLEAICIIDEHTGDDRS
jgi:hypothetical protein